MSIDYSLLGGAESAFPPTPQLERGVGSSNSSVTTNPRTPSESVSVSSDEEVAGGKRDYLTAKGRKEKGNGKMTVESGKKAVVVGDALITSVDEANLKSSNSNSKPSPPMPADPADFLWLMTEEPHRSRRMAILKAHPEVRKLMGYTRATAPLVLLVVTIQLCTAIALRNTHPFTWKFMLTAYALGGTCNQNIFLSIHEITHNLAFKNILPNKLLAMFSNIAIGIPYAMAFKGYHIEHHKFLGEDGIDTDLPSRFEALVLNNVFGKTFFATFQILFYALRPGFIRSQKPTIYHLMNVLFIIFTDFLLVHFFGWTPVLYLIFSSFFAGSLHPCAAHFIAEHYLMGGVVTSKAKAGDFTIDLSDEDEDGFKGMRELSQETTSYYGWLNLLCYNVGYHNEHHDFPSVPWTRLPKLHKLAHEFYDPLPSHPSWPAVTWQFITDPTVGMFSRVKRKQGEKGERIDPTLWNQCMETKATADQKENQIDALMEEAIERGYASDSECPAKKHE